MKKKEDPIKAFTGLTQAEAQRRLETDGFNELPSTKKHTLFDTALDILKEPMFILLIVCGILYLILGDIQEAVMLLFFVFVIISISIYQQRKTERALEALRDLSSPRALAIRDGKEFRIPGREVVKDDLLIVAEGDRVPADSVLVSSSHMTVDESLLTGESVPVRNLEWDGKLKVTPPGGDDLPFIYSGTLVVQGQGMAKVRATGPRTEMGKIGKALMSLESEDTFLQKETRRVVRNLAVAGFILCIIVVLTYSYMNDWDWVRGLLAGITLAMAILPEEFPVVLTIFLALGAWRLSKINVLTRRIPAVETLGAATVLCVDKTGTLTLNKMAVQKIFAKGKYLETSKRPLAIPEEFHEVVEFGVLASKVQAVDPMDKAVKDLCDSTLQHTEHIHHDWAMVQEYPLSKELLAMSQVWKSPDGKQYVIAAKGAPEAIADLCHFEKKRMDELSNTIGEMASEGLRILAVAKAYFSIKDLPKHQHDFKFEFLGLLGYHDPVRPGVKKAVKECYDAGIRVVMITGDYPGTAKCIAREIGLRDPDKILTGPEIASLKSKELQKRIKDITVCARVVPEQKLQLVNALKANGEIVAMTGDGVNDAPALKSAHIGIAMGAGGTDVARESAALVLLDNAFSSIVGAVKMGRRIFDNIKKAMAYILAIHIPIAGMSLIPIILDLPMAFLPVHIVFLELVIDPSCSVAFEQEAAEKNTMKRPPRCTTEPLFNKGMIMVGISQGIFILGMVLALFWFSHWRGQTDDETRAMAFTALIIANLSLILTNRSWSTSFISTIGIPNKAMWIVVSATLVFLGLVLYVPFLQDLFKFAPLAPFDIMACIGAGIVSVIWFEILKICREMHRKSKGLC